MAASSLRIVRRRRGSGAHPTLTAASQPILDTRTQIRAPAGGPRRDNWQELAWDMLDAVGELRYYVGWRASSCSRCRLMASEYDPETGLPTGVTENTQVADIVRAIAGGTLGQSQLVRRVVECLTVPGEVWVAIVPTDNGEQWLALNRDEIKSTGPGGTQIELPDGAKHKLDLSTDSLFRVWNPRPRRYKEADSPVRATLDSLREIVRTTKTISNASKSRLIGNGVVFVPNEMSLPAQRSPTPQDTDGSPEPEFLQGAPAVSQLQELLYQVATTAYDDEDSLAALIPMFAGVPGEQVKNVSHLKFDNTITDTAIKTRNDAISRLAMGLDVSPERLLGLGNSGNHWSAWLVSDQDVQLHVTPVMETFCQALTAQVLRPVLERAGIDPDRYLVWYDTSQLTADPDKSDDATAAFDRGVINAAAYRDFLGLGDSGYDFDTLEGWKQWAQDQVSKQPLLLYDLHPLLDTIAGIRFPDPNGDGGGARPRAVPAAPDDGHSEPDTEPGSHSSTASVANATDCGAANNVEHGVVDLLTSRALELAGKRRRVRADHGRLRHVPMHETHRYMPAVPPNEVTRLIRGWDDAVDDDALSRIGIAGDRLRAAVIAAARRELTSQVVEAD